MSDETYLIEAAKQGNTEAFDRLWARHRDKVFRSLLRVCGGNPDTTHDVLQDALLNAFKALQQFRGDANFATWLYTIARRLCIRARRDLYQSPSQSLLITRQTLQRLPYPIPTH